MSTSVAPSAVAATDNNQQEGVEGTPERVRLPAGELSLDQLQQCWKDQEVYLNHLEEKLAVNAKELEEKTKIESSRREHLLVMRLTAKEQEIQELAAQVAELKSAQAPTSAILRSTLLDPAVNLLIQKLTKECENLKKQAEDKQNELAAWKFTSDSATGKRLMAKCRQLYQENEDLGAMISSGRLAKLEGELSLQKNLSDEMKQNQLEMDDFMTELDEDVEGLQSMIHYLQQQLKEAKQEIARLSGDKKSKETPRDKDESGDESHCIGEKRKHSDLSDEEETGSASPPNKLRKNARTNEDEAVKSD